MKFDVSATPKLSISIKATESQSMPSKAIVKARFFLRTKSIKINKNAANNNSTRFSMIVIVFNNQKNHSK